MLHKKRLHLRCVCLQPPEKCTEEFNKLPSDGYYMLNCLVQRSWDCPVSVVGCHANQHLWGSHTAKKYVVLTTECMAVLPWLQTVMRSFRGQLHKQPESKSYLPTWQPSEQLEFNHNRLNKVNESRDRAQATTFFFFDPVLTWVSQVIWIFILGQVGYMNIHIGPSSYYLHIYRYTLALTLTQPLIPDPAPNPWA